MPRVTSIYQSTAFALEKLQKIITKIVAVLNKLGWCELLVIGKGNHQSAIKKGQGPGTSRKGKLQSQSFFCFVLFQAVMK